MFVYNEFKDILLYAHSNGFHTSCVTNGSLITDDIAKLIKFTDMEVFCIK